ncbi:hypothetical protein J6T66_05525 [bacterium]|nr:hypothetical protein [bacterium]
MEFLDDDPSNDEIGKGVLENNKLNDRLQSALKRDIRCTNECINAIDYVDKDKLSEEALKNLLNLKQQLVLIKEESIKEKYVGIEDITQDEFYILCGNKSLTEDEVKKIVKHALENKEDEMVVLMSLK